MKYKIISDGSYDHRSSIGASVGFLFEDNILVQKFQIRRQMENSSEAELASIAKLLKYIPDNTSVTIYSDYQGLAAFISKAYKYRMSISDYIREVPIDNSFRNKILNMFICNIRGKFITIKYVRNRSIHKLCDRSSRNIVYKEFCATFDAIDIGTTAHQIRTCFC